MVKLGPSLRPVSIIHARQPDLSWIVWETLRSWTISPAGRDRARRTGAVVDRHQVRVSGQAPGRPGVYADYTVIVSRYGGETGWWVRPGPDAWPGHRGGLAARAAVSQDAAARQPAPPGAPRARSQTVT